jgi:hypothetical protein
MADIDTSAEAVARMLDGVTPGPWTEHDKGKHPNGFVAGAIEDYEHGPDKPVVAYVVGMNVAGNRRFIAWSRDAVPALAVERDRLAAQLTEARAAWEAFKGATVSDDHFAAVDRLDKALGVA